ncbi:peptidase S8 and S53 subtilisin kexin sedolisin [Dinoroseobacter shibae DFL 12 = DSM 16493]|jgi:subtilisin family serine protease|uniref:Peptidase S8 and S53 subtilisin kexin sedolisin n=1 Tax=Dinoroseobacter shibae (strain DSM 16493 / NCIMB 14021 / DFL 12) TaxID=398580 RepID=A8LLJ6_DINSH|nr:S8 family serine peptidase [Dinoroseobacter shibae]ABV92006.1 peptidase S8 and S53 subtilisin kexin sedolisin [Dinoroseobacter shibae DFL 12 = DSM 16493]URF46973.1 S8 family serine peptidase [Dinoroseobacter shibae]URF51284.1 S8 family serine peptidase [Dinoroseobacter shibae]
MPGSGQVLNRDGHPTHIVVFEKPSENNAAMLSSMLGDRSPKGANGALRFQARGARKTSALLYERLAVAEMDMTEAEARDMRDQSGIAAVERNEVMSIPRPVRLDPAEAQEAEEGLRPPSRAMGAERDAYLRGVRDLANMLLGEGPRPTGPAGAQGFWRPRNWTTWGLDAIGSDRRPELTGEGVKVAVLDTGLDLTHPDFTDVLGARTASFVGTETAQDGHGHGTHCCGTVAGPLQPALGPRYGVAPGAELLVGKVLADDGFGMMSQIIDGITWALNEGAQVISMSLGSARAEGAGFSRVYEMVFRRLLSEGVLPICAAGNESDRPGLIAPVGNPAACPGAMAVAAVDRRMDPGDFSCGQVDRIGLLDIAGPGVGVHSAWTGGGYRRISGTSMATPHVAGVAALHLQADPSTTGDDLRALMKMQATALGPVRDFGAGLVQVPANPGVPVG